MVEASEAWHAVKPTGLAVALLAITIVFTPMILVVVGLRIWVRVTHHCFGLEDWLMCIGATLNLVHNGVVIWGSFTGIGTADSKLNTAMVMEGFKAVTFWQIFYISSSMFIKISICAQLLRVTDNKRIKMFLWGLIGLTVLITLMHRTLKIMANVVMGIGALASVATIVRLPYSPAYSQPSNQLHGIGNIILWTVIECSLGIIAGSMPMLRKLFKALRKDDSSYARGTDDINLVTIGQVRGKHHPIYDGDVRATVAAGDDRGSDRDDESTRQIIRVIKEFEQISVIEKPPSRY
ncbi:integral membrane protein PTH11 [Fusarium globosum]|uniref:Integral membrane protein PTH11 n=1 Tax=Fusarium globosum TaxID=78864 RepID=A0A8H6DCM3_9HYPO|nr:integral membrane protein PTH11 [Fusarium globosum]